MVKKVVKKEAREQNVQVSTSKALPLKENTSLILAQRDFMSDIYRNHLEHKRHFETKLQWILGASAIIIGLTAPYISSSHNPGVIIISFAALLSFLVALYGFEPFNKLTYGTHNTDDVMFYKSFEHMTPQEYAEKLKNVDSIDKIASQYAYDLNNMVKRNIKPMRNYIKISTRILFLGMLTGLIVIVLTL
jgi:hypothetical protein